MNRSLISLLMVLLIQSGLVLVVYWPSHERDGTPETDMAPLDRSSIQQIYVGDEFDNETVLQKTGERWSLPELEDLPADSAMVDRLLSAITSNDGSWAVAESVAARQRFRVASYHYRRRISLLGENQSLGTVYLGTSPGYRKVYARNEAQNAIYSIQLNVHDVPGNSDAWLDRKLLQTRAPLAITADAYSVRLDGDGWLSGINKVPDERELEALLATLRGLTIEGLASEDEQRDLAETEAELVLAVESLAGEVTLELFRIAEKYFVHSSEYALFFKLTAYDYERLTTIDMGLIAGETPD